MCNSYHRYMVTVVTKLLISVAYVCQHCKEVYDYCVVLEHGVGNLYQVVRTIVATMPVMFCTVCLLFWH